MKKLLITVCHRSIVVSCDKQRSDVGIYFTYRIKPVTGILFFFFNLFTLLTILILTLLTIQYDNSRYLQY